MYTSPNPRFQTLQDTDRYQKNSKLTKLMQQNDRLKQQIQKLMNKKQKQDHIESIFKNKLEHVRNRSKSIKKVLSPNQNVQCKRGEHKGENKMEKCQQVKNVQCVIEKNRYKENIVSKNASIMKNNKQVDSQSSIQLNIKYDNKQSITQIQQNIIIYQHSQKQRQNPKQQQEQNHKHNQNYNCHQNAKKIHTSNQNTTSNKTYNHSRYNSNITQNNKKQQVNFTIKKQKRIEKNIKLDTNKKIENEQPIKTKRRAVYQKQNQQYSSKSIPKQFMMAAKTHENRQNIAKLRNTVYVDE